ncbi:metallophosphoesterase [Sorangium sp. So ce367]|uniref:metallophosphoesterase n=1 Tax=Sorangium sp. So ce367 TaxID=3133305 RepID=UPI003F60A146
MRRVIVISDLHIGGHKSPMLGHPEVLADFLRQLAAYEGHDELELVIAGDFIDFLAEEPLEPWTPTEDRAVEKLEAMFQRLPSLFNAFALCAQRLPRFTILVGNHDIELAYPRVRESLFRQLGTNPHRCHFVVGNDAYRVGELLVEHGNRYDPWNAVDHDGLRQIASAASRRERAPRSLEVCPGALLVHGAMNPLKERYHFIDLLKPEGKILALLFLEMEPTIVKKHLRELFRLASSWVAQRYRKAVWTADGDGIAPTHERLVAGEDAADMLPVEVRRAFYQELAEIEARQERHIGAGGVLDALHTIVLGREEDGLSAMFARGEAIPRERLRKIQVALRSVPNRTEVFEEGFVDGDCHSAAKKLAETGTIKVVVMGHTHLAREIALPGGGYYINTGTWADLIRVDQSLLEDTDAGRDALEAWLLRITTNQLHGIREHRPSYADVRLNDGRIAQDQPILRWYREDERVA